MKFKTTAKKAEDIIVFYMHKDVIGEYEEWEAQWSIDRYEDFLENPNVNVTTSEVNRIYRELVHYNHIEG